MSSKKWLSVLFILIIVFTYPYSRMHSKTQDEMNVHFIDVGQGDSILIETPTGKVILIDGGPPKAGKKVVAYLEKLKVKEIDLLIATHPDIDHIGGLPHIMKSIKVAEIIDPGKLHTTKTYAKYINQIRKQKIPVKIAKQSERIKVDELLNIQILNTFERTKNNNQSSIALKISFREIDFLLMGDVERRQESELLEKYDLKAEVIKVAHHGSKTSSSLSFLHEVNPKIALLTYSKKNEYGHPVNRVIENLNKMNAHIYSTAVFGNVVIRTNGESYFILPEKSPADGLLEKSG